MTLDELHNPLKHFSCAREPARWDVTFSVCIVIIASPVKSDSAGSSFYSDASLLGGEMEDSGFVLVDFFRSWRSWNSD
jgi:hypothetical protein